MNALAAGSTPGWVRNDVELAWRFAIDQMVVDAISRASPQSATGDGNAYEEIR